MQAKSIPPFFFFLSREGIETTPPAPNEALALEPEFQSTYGSVRCTILCFFSLFFTILRKYLNQDLLPASIAASFTTPQVPLDANPDSDTEADFATGDIFV